MPSLRRPLCFLVRRNPTVGLARILERSYSLSKKISPFSATVRAPHILPFIFFHFPSFLTTNSIHFLLSFLSFPPFFFFPFCFPFLFLFLISFCFSFLLFLFLFALSLPFWSIDRMGQNLGNFLLPFLKPNVWLFIFLLFILFLNPLL